MSPSELTLAAAGPNQPAQFSRRRLGMVDERCARAFKMRADHFLRADVHRSLRIARLLFAAAEVNGNGAVRALGLLAEANARALGLGQFQHAIALYDEAASIYASLGRPADQARSQVGKIAALRDLGRYEEAQHIGEWAGRVLEAHAELRPLANLVMNLGTMFDRMGRFGRALEQYERAASLCERMGADAPEGMHAMLQVNRGLALRALGRFDESIAASEEAHTGFLRVGHTVEAARALQSLALTYFVLGRYNEALDRLDRARAIFVADMRPSNVAMVDLFISECLLHLRRFPDVLEKCQSARALFSEIGSQHVAAQAAVNEAIAYAELARHDEALATLDQAREIFAAEGNRAWTASTDLERAGVLLKQANPRGAMRVALDCAGAFDACQLPIEAAQARLVAGRAALALGAWPEAERLAHEAVSVARAHDIPALKHRGLHLIGALAEATDDAARALEAYDEAIAAMEQMRGRLMVEFRAGFLEDKEGIYEDVAELCLRLERPELAFQYAERAKSRALVDLIAHRLDLGIRARDASDQALVDDLIRLRAERDQRYRFWEADVESTERGWTSTTSARHEAQQEVLALERQITDRWHRLLVRNADYARDASLWQVRAEPAQQLVPPDTVLVEYFVVRSQPIVFLVTREAIRCLRLSGTIQEASQAQQQLWLNLRAVPRSTAGQIVRQTSSAQSVLRRLWDLLWSPLVEAINGCARVIVVPHGPLHYLPFHALFDGNRYLIERAAIHYLPSASFLHYCQPERPSRAQGAIAVGYSLGGRLPHASQEALDVAARLRGDALADAQATLERVRAAAQEARVLHIAAHGDFRPDNPLFSGVQLADGWLTTLDIFNLRLKASLVTLSACQTGRSVVGGGDELLGLMRAFTAAGASSLVMSQWAVEDRSTAHLMSAFYSGLTQGSTKAEALRHAQAQFIDGACNEGAADELWRHPYFWAPFFLVGDGGVL